MVEMNQTKKNIWNTVSILNRTLQDLDYDKETIKAALEIVLADYKKEKEIEA